MPVDPPSGPGRPPSKRPREGSIMAPWRSPSAAIEKPRYVLERINLCRLKDGRVAVAINDGIKEALVIVEAQEWRELVLKIPSCSISKRLRRSFMRNWRVISKCGRLHGPRESLRSWSGSRARSRAIAPCPEGHFLGR